MAKLTVRDLHTHFGSVRAVDGVSLDVRDGEFLVLLGASGSGKTTLMRTIAGLEKATSGEVVIGDRVVNGLPPNDRNIAMVFQSYALYPHKSVFKNISFPLEAVRTDKARIKERVEWAANLFGIGHLLHRKPRMLSGGERQRVALARALVREPNLFLLDEPLSNLDAKLRHQARHELKKLHGRIGITTIYVTHDQVEAMGLGERVAVMNFGKIEQIGRPSDIYREPANTFVARFMGSPAMNLILKDGEVLGFHPENFLPVGESFQPGPDALRLPFVASGLEDLGADLLLYGEVPGADTSPMGEANEVIAKLPARLAGDLEVGREHEFFVHRRFVKRFDPQTGRRVDAPAAA
ncbi:MAG TPA: ABC transporter ATP-binding protein [Trueperaceae bacterium]